MWALRILFHPFLADPFLPLPLEARGATGKVQFVNQAQSNHTLPNLCFIRACFCLLSCLLRKGAGRHGQGSVREPSAGRHHLPAPSHRQHPAARRQLRQHRNLHCCAVHCRRAQCWHNRAGEAVCMESMLGIGGGVRGQRLG